jgi:hypothetical protein
LNTRDLNFFSKHIAVDDLTKTFTLVPLQSSRTIPEGEGLSIDAIDPSMYTCKKRLTIFPSPAGMSLTKLSLSGNNLIIRGQGEFGK